MPRSESSIRHLPNTLIWKPGLLDIAKVVGCVSEEITQNDSLGRGNYCA